MSGRLPDWLAEWIGVEAPTAGDSTAWQLESAWSWAPWATLLLVAGAILWTAHLYVRESSSTGPWYRALLTALRAGALSLLLIMLAQWALSLRLTGPPTLAIVVDRSASMSIVDRYDDTALVATMADRLREDELGEPSRLNLAKAIIALNDGRRIEELAKRYRLEVFYVAADIERQPGDHSGAEIVEAVGQVNTDGSQSGVTRLGDAVRQVLDGARGTLPAGIILLSDGVTTEGTSLADAAAEARRKGVPIFSVGLGSDQAPRDIELADLLVDDVVFVDDLVSFQIQIKSTGLGGEAARVVLRREGESQPIAEQEVTLNSDRKVQTMRLIDRPTKAGDATYVIEVVPHDDEIDKDNNLVRRTVSVRDEKIRVLLAFGYPSYEFRFLKSLLERDSKVELSTYLQEADPDYAEQDKTALGALPVDRDELFEFDVAVIGDMNPRLLPRSFWKNLREFVVEKGGGVAFIAGPRYFPWLYRDIAEVANLLPIEIDALDPSPTNALPGDVTDGFIVRPTPLGLQSATLQLGDSLAETEQIWRSLAPLYWIVEIDKLKPAAQVLAEHPTQTGLSGHNLPVIVFQYVGAGRVLFQAIDSTWRWRIGAGNAYFARYWVQAIRNLARGALSGRRDAELIADRREYQRGDSVKLRARFFDGRIGSLGEDVTVLLESPGRASRRIELMRDLPEAGVFESIIADLPEGRYQVLLTAPRLPGSPPMTRFAIVAPPGEFARTEMERAALTAAADLTRGEFYTFEDADQLFEDLPVGRRVPIQNLPPLTIWNQWWLLAAFLTCITCEWILRKRAGML